MMVSRDNLSKSLYLVANNDTRRAVTTLDRFALVNLSAKGQDTTPRQSVLPVGDEASRPLPHQLKLTKT